MTAAEELARTLVEYDATVARELYEVIVRELGGRLDDVPADSDSVTTSEWKEGLARYERLRSLGVALERALP